VKFENISDQSIYQLPLALANGLKVLPEWTLVHQFWTKAKLWSICIFNY